MPRTLPAEALAKEGAPSLLAEPSAKARRKNIHAHSPNLKLNTYLQYPQTEQNAP
jgi:hypothetical protein